MEYCSSSLNNQKKQFSGNVLSQLAVLCSSALSHPLYLSYFLFFSPYLIKLIAFLSPLFFTTTLLILAHEKETGFDGIGDESVELEGFEENLVYIAVFGSEISSFEQPPDDRKEEKVLGVLNLLIAEERKSPVESCGEIKGKFCGIPFADDVGGSEMEDEMEEEKILGVLISDEQCFPAPKLIIDDVKAGEKSPPMADNKCAVSSFNKLELTPSSINGGNQVSHSTKHVWDSNDEKSRATKKHDDEDKFSYSSSPVSQPISPCLSNLGSVRREKEWRRTLACKLFEERHNGGGSEEMDSLWEAYEKTEENKGKQRSGLQKTKSGLSFGGEDDNDDEDEEEEGDTGKLCCLQALKFSAVKINFGMGKPGFVKITKAFKGGWLNLSHHGGAGARKKSNKR